MILYHGTNLKSLDKMVKNGLLPSNETKKRNWKSMKSRSGFVFLTDSYAGFYAMNAQSEDEKDFPVVLRIDTKDQMLYPDEDFLGQVEVERLRQLGMKHDLIGLTQSISIVKNQWLWEKSLQFLGTCCSKKLVFHGWLVEAAVFRDNSKIWQLAGDPVIKLRAYQVMGEWYRELTKFAFNDVSYPIRFPGTGEEERAPKWEDCRIEIIKF